MKRFKPATQHKYFPAFAWEISPYDTSTVIPGSQCNAFQVIFSLQRATVQSSQVYYEVGKSGNPLGSGQEIGGSNPSFVSTSTAFAGQAGRVADSDSVA